MKTLMKNLRPRHCALLPWLGVLLLLAGCLEKNLLWSPDGSRAVLLGEDGLYLCDGSGSLSPLQVPAVYRAAWLGDSLGLVLARSHKTGSWDEISRVLGPERAGLVAAHAEELLRRTQAGAKWGGNTMNASGRESATLDNIYLRARFAEALRAKLDGDEWAAVLAAEAEVQDLFLARIANGTVTPGSRLYEGIGRIREIRVAPGDHAVAFVAEDDYSIRGNSEDTLLLRIVTLDGAAPVLVASHVAQFPDWTPDGRSLVFMQAAAGPERDELRLGTLVQREVVDGHGAAAPTGRARELAGWMFSDRARVRCLRDGRMLFNAAELSLPIAAEDFDEHHEQLFALDPARQTTLTRLVPRKREAELPQTLAFFEVSPDERQVLFGDLNGTVAVLTLADGAVEHVQGATKANLQGQPVWRRAGEFSYTRYTGAGAARRAEVVLRQGGKDTVLSSTWPDAVVNHLVSDKK